MLELDLFSCWLDWMVLRGLLVLLLLLELDLFSCCLDFLDGLVVLLVCLVLLLLVLLEFDLFSCCLD